MEAAKELVKDVAGKVTNALTTTGPRNDQHGIISHNNQYITTNFGTRVSDDRNSLTVGSRGPTLLEDFIFREKMTHFDHERIPERVVHARGTGAHGYFQVYESLAEYTSAQFLNDTTAKTPVFVRFSTVLGSKGSKDTARDVRGFATRFYTKEGNFDLVGNNIPVFFIQDAIKFPDIIHAGKPEPDKNIPQAATAHDTFWDFISLQPETMHMVMWTMSDRAIPRSYAMMEGFGVHSFRLVNAEGKSKLVKFHWKPILGIHSLAWDEAEKIGGKNLDFHRQDLYDAIEAGQYPEYELGLQIMDEEDQLKYGFDLLDSTKLVPEELVPVKIVGKLVLNRVPDNFFAEVEQIAFHTGHIVPGIDFSDDPLLHGRNFSYIDTQLNRFGTPNFYQLPINQPVNAAVRNNQQDGFMRMENLKGRVNYEPNSLGGGCPFAASIQNRGFVTWPARIEGNKVRERSASFSDHFSQATLFYNSMTEIEKGHMIDALRFEIGSVETLEIRQRMIDLLNHIDHDMATKVAEVIGVDLPPVLEDPKYKNHGKKSAALSQLVRFPTTAKGRKIAFIVNSSGDPAQADAARSVITAAQGTVEVIGNNVGPIDRSADSKWKGWEATWTILNSSSVLFDAVMVFGDFSEHGKVIGFLAEAFKHCKPVGVGGGAQGALLLVRAGIPVPAGTQENGRNELGVVTGNDGTKLGQLMVESLLKHRHWEREKTEAWKRIPV